MKRDFLNYIHNNIVVLDGATGSNLQKLGLPVGECPELWILDNKRHMIELQKQYINAGSRILYAPTFGANRIKLEEYGLEDKLDVMNQQLIQLTKQAIIESECSEKVYVAGNLTMTGRQLEPIGDFSFEELVNVYKEQVMYMLLEGVDLIVIETMMSLNECRAAVLAVKEISDLPIFVTLTFQENNRTFYGTSPSSAALVLQSMGIDAIGVNCSTGPDKMVAIVQEMKDYSKIPIIVKPNAGLPTLQGDETVFSLDPVTYGKEMLILMKEGATIVGGCCGTTPCHIEELVKQVVLHKEELKLPIFDKSKGTRALATERTILDIPFEGEFIVIGERINPTGKKELQKQLLAKNFDLLLEMAQEQVDNGAKILDINLGMNGIDELEMMGKAMEEITKLLDIPLAIDSSHISVIEAALRQYPGRALINSISLEKEKMDALLPIAKKYGAMFILLPLSGAGLPKDQEEKKKIIHTILEEALRIGLTKEDIIVDGLVNTVGANKNAARETLETITYCKEVIGIATTIGLSNISFGLPQRQYVNSTFLTLCIYEGLTMAIANPSQQLLMNSAYATNLLQGTEESDVRYINRVTRAEVETSKEGMKREDYKKEEHKKEDGRLKIEKREQEKEVTISNHLESIEPNPIGEDETNVNHPIFISVLKGNKRNIIVSIQEELNAGGLASVILNTLLIPAINNVGDLFDKQIYFLPQLISSAETMKLGIEYLEPLLQENMKEVKGKIVIATVAGDVHDIGKNLVALMLKNYGYEVIDLGKDVKSATIIQVAKDNNADIIALSALMTTTMLEMKQVIRLKKEEGLSCKVIIGGAVITNSYAVEIGADGYSKDAGETVKLVKKIMGDEY